MTSPLPGAPGARAAGPALPPAAARSRPRPARLRPLRARGHRGEPRRAAVHRRPGAGAAGLLSGHLRAGRDDGLWTRLREPRRPCRAGAGRVPAAAPALARLQRHSRRRAARRAPARSRGSASTCRPPPPWPSGSGASPGGRSRPCTGRSARRWAGCSTRCSAWAAGRCCRPSPRSSCWCLPSTW